MTTITIERRLLEQALAAIQELEYASTAVSDKKARDAKQSIRAALAAPATESDERAKELETELAATEVAIAEYRQQCLDNAAEVARLKAESEERLQNCAALVAENERLRKDAERYRWFAKYLVSDDESYDDAIVCARTVEELSYVVDTAMKGTP